jgi:hypothetical protein
VRIDVEYDPKQDLVRAGLVIHSSMDSMGRDGIAVWVDLRGRTAQYTVAGNDLEGIPVKTREFEIEEIPDEDGKIAFSDEWELLVHGINGCAFVQRRNARMNFRQRKWEGSLAIFNSSRRNDDGKPAEVHFTNINMTFLDPPKLPRHALAAVREGGVQGAPKKFLADKDQQRDFARSRPGRPASAPGGPQAAYGTPPVGYKRPQRVAPRQDTRRRNPPRAQSVPSGGRRESKLPYTENTLLNSMVNTLAEGLPKAKGSAGGWKSAGQLRPEWN